MNNIYLIGMPGCGKSEISKRISAALKIKRIDLDSLIEEKENITISLIFEQFGEEYFRDKETYYLKSVSNEKNAIIATGGGIIKRQENIDIMKNTGEIIFIDTPVENILKNSQLKNRPLLAGNKEYIRVLYDERYDKYKQAADVIVENTRDIKTAVNKILEKI